MAALDDDSEDEGVSHANIASTTRKSTPKKELGGLPNAVPDYEVELVDSDAEDSGSATLAKKTEARSNANKADTSGSSAYERMKQQLLSKPEAPQTKPATNAASSGESEDDEPVPTKAVRKRLSKPVHRVSKSPTSTSAHSREASPTLFVSPAAPSSTRLLDDNVAGFAASDSDDLPELSFNPRLRELLAEQKAKRQAKEAAACKKADEQLKAQMTKRAQLLKSFKEIYSSEMDDGMDEDALRSLTQQSKPTRKAGRKALEEMSRETQRMARNQQLAHEAKTKKKITTKDLFKVFNFRQGNDRPATPPAHADDENTRSGVLVSSDIECQSGKDTPPTSPPQHHDFQDKFTFPTGGNEEDYIIRTGIEAESDGEDLPTLQEVFSQPVKVDKRKTKTTEPSLHPPKPHVEQNKRSTLPKQFRVLPPQNLDADSDDDLEIVAKKPSRFAVFDQLPTNNGSDKQSFRTLRALAHLNTSEKPATKGHTSLTMGELQTQLQERARQQALLEKLEKIERLRAQGIEISTEEDNEQLQRDVEVILGLEQARTDAQDLAKKEREAATKDGDGEGARDILSDDEDEDGDWVEEQDEAEADADVELSGSEDEDQDVDGEEEGDGGILIDNEAGEDEDEEVENEDEDAPEQSEAMDLDELADDDEEAAIDAPSRIRAMGRGRKVVIDDEDGEEDAAQPPTQASQASQDDTMAAFGFQVPKMNGLGLTQMFNSTMGELESLGEDTQDQGSLAFLRESPKLSGFGFSMTQDSQSLLVKDSQTSPATNEEETQFSFGMSQFPSQMQVGSAASPTKFSEVPEPTQDAGFETFRARLADSNEPHSTVETVMAPIPESPAVVKKGKLRRRAQTVAVLSDDEEGSDNEANTAADGGFDLTTDAFDVLFKAAKKAPVAEAYDKQRSEAKKMVEEQAEESEDEYAGLGGVSDDEDNGEMDEEMKEMIDEGPVDIDEGKIAQLYADKERAEDEKNLNKLYKDITTGGLRRKRGMDLGDLSDSDEEADERLRERQIKNQRMRDALLKDEKIGKIGMFSYSRFRGHC